jgi:hypothetical protein
MSATRKRPDRAKAPRLRPAAELRETELIGLAEDGRMIFWQNGLVRPITAFRTSESHGRRWIRDGHYVIEWKGHAITVYCSNTSSAAKSVVVQFMCSNRWCVSMPVAQVEAMLLGEVVDPPEHRAKMDELWRNLFAALEEAGRTPERARGRIPT